MGLASVLAPIADASAQEVDGKELLYRKHVDAAHVSFHDGILDVQVVDVHTPRNADDVAVRLGPDANGDGSEVSRIAVPSGPEWSFLGKPGELVWNAPQQNYDNWAPVWAGIGAGDMPENIDPKSIALELVDDGGPGDVEVYRTNYAGAPMRELSTSPDAGTSLRVQRLKPKAHGHYNWAFTKPGKYDMQWRATARTVDGKELSSGIRTVTWYVGTDTEAGLPEGSYVGTPITKPASPSSDSPTQPGEPAPDSPAPAPEAPSGPPADNPTKNSWNPDPAASTCTHISAGHLDVRAREKDGDMTGFLRWDAPDGKTHELPSRSFVIEVPDSTSTAIPSSGATADLAKSLGSDKAYALPEVQDENLPWVGFSTEGLDVPEGSKISVELISYGAPSTSARFAMGHYDALQSKFVVDIDSENRDFQSIAMRANDHSHRAQFFSEPGFYTIYYAITVVKPDGTQNYGTLDAWYAVGSNAINWACERTGEAPTAPVDESKPATDAPSVPDNASDPGTVTSPAPPTAAPTPSDSPASNSSDADEAAPTSSNGTDPISENVSAPLVSDPSSGSGDVPGAEQDAVPSQQQSPVASSATTAAEPETEAEPQSGSAPLAITGVAPAGLVLMGISASLVGLIGLLIRQRARRKA